MSPARFARPAGLLMLTFLVVSAKAQDADKQDKPEKANTTAKPDDKPVKKPASPGDELVKQAIEKMDKLGWISTDIRQSIFVRGMKVEAKGRYVHGQGDRVLYELQTAVAGGTGRNQVVCDGKTVWRIAHVGEQKSIQKYDQKELLERAKAADEGDDIEREVDKRMRDDIIAMHGFAGVRTLLEDLGRQLRFPDMEPTVLPGSNGKISVYLLKGEWTPQTLESILPKTSEAAKAKNYREMWDQRQEFINVPRQCRLYLGKAGATDLWPYRVEWLGPNRVGGEDQVLSVLELSDPVVAESPPADADKHFAVRLSAEEEKLVEKVPVSEFLKGQREGLVRMRQEQERAKSGARALDPTQLGVPVLPVKPTLQKPSLQKP